MLLLYKHAVCSFSKPVWSTWEPSFGVTWLDSLKNLTLSKASVLQTTNDNLIVSWYKILCSFHIFWQYLKAWLVHVHKSISGKNIGILVLLINFWFSDFSMVFPVLPLPAWWMDLGTSSCAETISVEIVSAITFVWGVSFVSWPEWSLVNRSPVRWWFLKSQDPCF
jgi:hypothetical protein